MLYLINQTLAEEKAWLLENMCWLIAGACLCFFILIVLFMIGANGNSISRVLTKLKNDGNKKRS